MTRVALVPQALMVTPAPLVPEVTLVPLVSLVHAVSREILDPPVAQAALEQAVPLALLV